VKAAERVLGQRVALVHDYWVTVRGGERVFQGLARLFPEADTYVLIRDPRVATPPELARLRTTYLQWIPFGHRHFRALLPLYPIAARRLDLRGYDLVISSSSGFCHAARTDGIHICYCHSPLRYAWNEYDATLALQPVGIRRALLAATLDSVRRADLAAARHVTTFVANSTTVRDRIATYYGRPSTVVHPFIDAQRFRLATRHNETFLVVSQLLPYKRVDLAIEACAHLGLKLQIIGVGPDRARLERLAGPTITFRGRVSEEDLGAAYANCAALVQCGEEDFGMAALEAQAAGRPVIAFGAGGALETVSHGRTGMLFKEQTVEGLMEALCAFDPDGFDSDAIRAHAQGFSEAVFQRRMLDVLRDAGVAPALWGRDLAASATAPDPARHSRASWRLRHIRYGEVVTGCADGDGWRQALDQGIARW
jgi:glycosyltransferase involved in cell wall biosynthesis